MPARAAAEKLSRTPLRRPSSPAARRHTTRAQNATDAFIGNLTQVTIVDSGSLGTVAGPGGSWPGAADGVDWDCPPAWVGDPALIGPPPWGISPWGSAPCPWSDNVTECSDVPQSFGNATLISWEVRTALRRRQRPLSPSSCGWVGGRRRWPAWRAADVRVWPAVYGFLDGARAARHLRLPAVPGDHWRLDLPHKHRLHGRRRSATHSIAPPHPNLQAGQTCRPGSPHALWAARGCRALTAAACWPCVCPQPSSRTS